MELLLIILLCLLLWFWWDSVGAKEIAVRKAKQLCQETEVLFLDDSVALYRLRFSRSRVGTILFQRRYEFEFCSDGEHRYSGYIEMLGKIIQRTHMDTYRVTDTE